MVESLISAAIAVVTGGFVLSNRIHSSIAALDRRIDGVELAMATSYVSKSDFEKVLQRMESHMIRIEDKLDALAETRRA